MMCRSLVCLMGLLIACAGARGAIFSTALHPVASQGRIEILVGTASIYRSELLAITGTAEVEPLGGPNSRVFFDATINMQDIAPVVVDVFGAGTVTLSATNIRAHLFNGYFNRSGNDITLETGFPLGFSGGLLVSQGLIQLTNPTGLVALLAPGGFTLDLSQDPINLAYANLAPGQVRGTFDEGPGGFTGRPEINVGNPTFVIDSIPDVDGIDLTVRYEVELHFAGVPETSSWLLAGVGVGTLGLMARRRFSVC